MRALVTGAAGLLGGHVVDALLAGGHAVHAVDRVALGRPLPAGSRATVADLAGWDGLDAAMAEADAILHLAAIPNLDSDPEEFVHRVNVELTARVAFAAIRAGRARRFLYASSQTALGLSLAPGFVAPNFIPVDESHPDRPREGYGLSKLAGEQACALVSNRLGIPTIAIRLPVIWALENFDRHVTKRTGDPLQAAKSLYAYVDARDAGEAFRLALEADWTGFERVQIGADRPFADRDVRLLAAEHYGVVEQRGVIDADTPLYAIGRARRVLGFEPRYRWSTEEIEDTSRREGAFARQQVTRDSENLV